MLQLTAALLINPSGDIFLQWALPIKFMQQSIIFILLASFSCLSLGAGCLENTLWEQCRETENIQICSAEFGNSEFLAFRGKTKINAPLKQIVPVFYDVENYNDWQVNVKDIKIVQDIIPPGKRPCVVERIEHSYGKKPWLVRWAFWVPDSDFVYKASYNLSPDAKHFALLLENDKSLGIPEENNYQRGIVQSCYVLDSSEDSNETFLQVELWVDLKLDIDSSRINENLQQWPKDIIKGLRNQVAKPGSKVKGVGMNAFINDCVASDEVN